MLFAVAALLRSPLLDRSGLWADEFFSLAMATGHSMEHPAATADPTTGDFVEGPAAQSAAAWQRYLSVEAPPAGPRRVTRAVLLSDTSPPLYYVLLSYWLRVFGTHDASLIMFSVAWALAAWPFIWLLARRLGGIRAAISAAILYAAAPAGLYYAAEGRMYSLLWCLTAAFMWLTVRLHDRGSSPARLALWLGIGAAGFLTHYFFAFPWAACLIWLWRYPGRARLSTLATATVGTLVLVLPWYLGLPASLRRWRITGDWLAGSLTVPQIVSAPFTLAWDLIAGRGVWGGIKRADRVAQAVIAVSGITILFAKRRAFFPPRTQLIWLCLAAACLGPLAFDLLLSSTASLQPRYALAGLPAAILAVALTVRAMPPVMNAVAVALLLGAWAPGIRAALRPSSRSWEPYREYATAAAQWAGPDGLVLVHAIPTGVLGITRYLPPDTPVAAWVGQLGTRRVPDDITALVANRRRVAFIKLHHVGEPAPEEVWLREHLRVVRDSTTAASALIYFDAVTGATAR